jgi:YVTN family beta-propeller protein
VPGHERGSKRRCTRLALGVLVLSAALCTAAPVAGAAQVILHASVLPPAGALGAQQAPPVNVTPPRIAGVARVGRTVHAMHGLWSGRAVSYAYTWRRCGAVRCRVIATATSSTYTLGEADAGTKLELSVVAFNRAGASAPASAAPSPIVTGPHGPRPVNLTPPGILGQPEPGSQLTAAPGAWSNTPTSFEYEWQRCNAHGEGCVEVPLAASPSYPVAAADVGSTLRVVVTAFNAAGESAPASSPPSALVTSTTPPENVAPPAILGSPQTGHQLSASPGTWSGAPASFAFRWKRCNAVGARCKRIAAATAPTYAPIARDVGRTLRVAVIAANEAGRSAPALSPPSGVVSGPGQRPPVDLMPPTITGVARSGQTLTASPGTWANGPTSFSYQWQRCNASGGRCATVAGATSPQYALGAGDVGSTLLVSVIGSNSAGNSAPAVSAPSAVVTGPVGEVPANLAPPQISGAGLVGSLLGASPGTWSGSPTSFEYEWQRCSRRGARCAAIPGANAASYLLGALDVGATLRVSVVAVNAAGHSSPARSAPSQIVGTRNPVNHYEYVFNDGRVSVYDIDNSFSAVESFPLPGTNRGVRGVMVSPATHMLFVSFGGDGGGNGNGSVLAFDLVSKRVVWSVNLSTGIDSGAVSADGRLIYMPDGELSSDGNWYILDAASGAVVGKIATPGAGPHNTVLSADGKTLLLGGRNYNYLSVYDTQTGQLRPEIGPLVGGVRPLTINGSASLAFTTATGFDGFQVESLTSPGAVLYTERFGACSGPFSTCSHGVSLSPDSRQLFVIDTVAKAVQVWDVHGAAEGIAPVHVATVPVSGLQGSEEGCAYDCGRDGWVQTSLDGRYAFVGDSGDVIDTATDKVIATLPTLANTRKSVEIDWLAGVPVATSGRTGIGY